MIGCIIQARMGSSRLPGKVMIELDGKNTVLDYVINQLSFSELIDKKIIATTNLEQDDIIEQAANRLNLECFRGSSENVLERYYQCAKKYKIDNILRITSDCPLIDPQIVDKVIEKYLTGKYDYVSNTLVKTFPTGTDAEIFSFRILEKAWRNGTLPSEKEHVTPHIRNNKIDCRLGNLENTNVVNHLRLTLDRSEDLKLIKEIIKNIDKKPILLKDVLSLLVEKPELVKINAHIPSNEGMLKSLKRDNDEEKAV
ncbi:MAG: glycosyltransferase family protein [Pelagibacterales bacterium]|nr:glycosyltransferase family protein [Pelagibacterales bacterium]